MNVDTVTFLSEGTDKIISPEELLVLAYSTGFPIGIADDELIEYGESIAELIVRRMVLNAKMTFLAAYEYNTYSFGHGFMIVENPNDVNGYYIEGTELEATVDMAYAHLAEVLNGYY